MTEPIDAEELCRLSTPLDVAVSPDGNRIAFTSIEWNRSDDSRITALYVVPSDGSAPPHRLSRISDASQPQWSPDGSMLGFIGARAEDYERRIGPTGDEEEVDDDEPDSQVWAFDLDRGGDAIQLTDRQWGVRGFDWSPDGTRIVIDARDPTDEQAAYLERLEEDGPVEIERLQHRVDGVGFTDDVTSYLFIVDLETGEETRLDETAGAGAFEPLYGLQPQWHPSDEQIVFRNTDTDRPDDSVVGELFLVSADTGRCEKLTDEEMALGPASWSPTGDRLTVAGRDAANWYLPREVLAVDIADGTVTRCTASLDGTVSWFADPRFIDDETIIAGIGDAGRTVVYRLDLDGESPTELDVGIDTDQASIRALDVGGETVALTRSHPSDGVDVFAMDASLETPASQLTTLNEAFLGEYPQPNFTRTRSPSADGIEVESMVYYPDSFDPESPEPHPTIIWTHGGPMSYDDPTYAFHFAYLTSRGYVIVKPNYRGSTSYGSEFAETLRGRWGTADVEDTLAVVEDLVARDWIETDRLFATGFSYGGILTGFLITRTDRFTAAAAEHGIYDLKSEFGTSDSHVWLGEEFGLPWEDHERYREVSSISDIGNVETATLVTAGSEDWRCPPTQSEQLYVSLRKQGIPAKLVIYPGENHDISTPERAIHRLETLVDWFELHDPTVESE